METDQANDLFLECVVPPYVSDRERKKHIGHIVSIAQEQGHAVEDVAKHYERVLAELKLRARVPDYVDVFVARKVLELLKRPRSA